MSACGLGIGNRQVEGGELSLSLYLTWMVLVADSLSMRCAEAIERCAGDSVVPFQQNYFAIGERCESVFYFDVLFVSLSSRQPVLSG